MSYTTPHEALELLKTLKPGQEIAYYQRSATDNKDSTIKADGRDHLSRVFNLVRTLHSQGKVFCYQRRDLRKVYYVAVGIDSVTAVRLNRISRSIHVPFLGRGR